MFLGEIMCSVTLTIINFILVEKCNKRLDRAFSKNAFNASEDSVWLTWDAELYWNNNNNTKSY